MLVTQKLITQHTLTLGFPKNNVVLNNETTNEIYIQIQAFKNAHDNAAVIAELASAGFVFSLPVFISGLSIEIPTGSQYKILAQTIDGDTQVFLYFAAPIGLPIPV